MIFTTSAYSLQFSASIRLVSRIVTLLLSFFLSSGILLAEDTHDTSLLENTNAQYTQKKVEIEFVTVGDEGNLPFKQSRGDKIGGVDQSYEIGKYDITAEQYCAFLNAMAQSDFYGLYDSRMGSDPDVACIQRHGSVGHYTYSIIEDGKSRGQLPITYVTWESAARFCNWLTNDQPEGSEESGTTVRGIGGAAVMYRLPTLDEWYKAAYYKGGGIDAGYWLYATQSNDLPHNRIGNELNQMNYYYGKSLDYRKNYAVRSQPRLTPVGIFGGSSGYYGTFDMAGNVRQWLDETLFEDACGNIGWLKPGSPRPTSEPNSFNRYMFYHYAAGISWCYEDSWSDPSRGSHDHTFRLPWEGAISLTS